MEKITTVTVGDVAQNLYGDAVKIADFTYGESGERVYVMVKGSVVDGEFSAVSWGPMYRAMTLQEILGAYPYKPEEKPRFESGALLVNGTGQIFIYESDDVVWRASHSDLYGTTRWSYGSLASREEEHGKLSELIRPTTELPLGKVEFTQKK